MEKTITLNRSILQSAWFNEPFVAQIFIYLMFAADHSGFRLLCEDIGRGSTVTTMRTLAQETKLSPYRVGRSIKFLVDNGHVAMRRLGNLTVFTIKDFEALSGGMAAGHAADTDAAAPIDDRTDDEGEKDGIGFADATFSRMVTDYWNEKCTHLGKAGEPGREEYIALRRLVFHYNDNYGDTWKELSSIIGLISDQKLETTDDGEEISFGWLISDTKHIDYIGSKKIIMSIVNRNPDRRNTGRYGY